MPAKFTNNATATLAASLTTSSTSITVTTSQGALFPTLSAGDYFYATLTNSSNNIEIVKITARSGDVLTATRAQEGTTALAWNSADRLELRITAADLANFAQLDSANTFAVAIAAPSISVTSISVTSVAATSVATTSVTATGASTSATFLLTGVGASKLNVGATADRPTPTTGMIRYNSTISKFEGYGASTWGALGGGATGGGNMVFVENGQSVIEDYTITANNNAGSFGPISIAAGITVTVPTGSTWSIV
jgi:hypothetical protein